MIIRDGEKGTPACYILRGGSFLSLVENTKCDSIEKIDSPEFLDSGTGFRIVIAPEKPQAEIKESDLK